MFSVFLKSLFKGTYSQSFQFLTLDAFKQLEWNKNRKATYMLLQNNCLNNGVTDGLKQKKEKKHVKQLYMKK